MVAQDGGGRRDGVKGEVDLIGVGGGSLHRRQVLGVGQVMGVGGGRAEVRRLKNREGRREEE